jgi:hypothetical protein
MGIPARFFDLFCWADYKPKNSSRATYKRGYAS